MDQPHTQVFHVNFADRSDILFWLPENGNFVQQISMPHVQEKAEAATALSSASAPTVVSSGNTGSIVSSPAQPSCPSHDERLYFAVKKMKVDPTLPWTTRSPLDDEGPFIVFNEILCCGLHVMWQAIPCGKSRRAFVDKTFLDDGIGPHVTLLQLLEGDVKRHANSVIWETCQMLAQGPKRSL